MTLLPHTTISRIGRIEHGPRTVTKGVTIHVMEGTLAGTRQYFATSSPQGVGAHVGIGLDRCVQMADLDQICYHAPGDNVADPGLQNGNHEFIGFEHEGHASQTWRQWAARTEQQALSAHRCAWVLYHYKCGYPKWGHNVVPHYDFPLGGHTCPGPGFCRRLYMARVIKAYGILKLTSGRRWK